MRYTGRTSGYLSSEYFPTGVKWLLISNTALFLLYFFAVRADLGGLFYPFGLIPNQVLGSFAVWQLFTYMFLHDPYGFGHILFNMLTLWMFGTDLERTWGRRAFLKYYFLCGIGAGLCVVFGNALFGSMNTRTIGASGAIYGLLLAFGVLYPDRIVYFSFLFPIKAKYFVMIFGAIAFLSSFGGSGGGVSHVAHLGGMIFGYAYLKGALSRRRYSPRVNPMEWAARRYQQWKVERAKRKFQVYMRKQQNDRDRGPYVH
ncbi:MAG: rhomboid family intramembrane serine protease [Bryobacterales bacterium]|nr:rhomboid family intramembrane serine protease [Bryobacterales bacterium]MCZ2146208.1 rhomboid family intramembrane serine protease [Bryobacterales bacterium]